jgi:pimeloyl-ACP methyl ester carboxylesterase
MKTIRNFLFVLASICLLMTCSEKEEIFSEDISAGENLKCTRGKNHYHGLDQDRYVYMHRYDLRVHYRVIGKGPVNIVFIPGWTNPLTVYTKQFDFFRDKARCIYIDLPGHGLSDSPEDIEYTMELMADAIYDVIRKEGVHRFIAVGFSWGNSPLTQFEIKHPGMISRLILLDISIITWPPMTEEIREATYNVYLELTPEMKAAALEGLIPPATAPEDLIEFGNYFLDFPNYLLANMYYHYLAENVWQPYLWTIPILVIYRNMTSEKETNTRLYYPNCNIHVISGDQHVIQWAYHETVNQLMDDFIVYRHWKAHPHKRCNR